MVDLKFNPQLKDMSIKDFYKRHDVNISKGIDKSTFIEMGGDLVSVPTFLIPEEAEKKLDRIFKKIDKDKNGRISEQEMADFFRKKGVKYSQSADVSNIYSTVTGQKTNKPDKPIKDNDDLYDEWLNTSLQVVNNEMKAVEQVFDLDFKGAMKSRAGSVKAVYNAAKKTADYCGIPGAIERAQNKVTSWVLNLF